MNKKLKSNLKSFACILMTILMVFSVAPVTIEATASDTWAFDETTGTLYLNNYTAEETFTADSCENQIFYDGDLNIVVAGKNYLEMESYHAIYVKGNLNISGDGELYISGSKVGIRTNGDLIVFGGVKISTANTDEDFNVLGNIDMTNSTITAITDTITMSSENIKFSNCNIEADSYESSCAKIDFVECEIMLNNTFTAKNSKITLIDSNFEIGRITADVFIVNGGHNTTRSYIEVNNMSVIDGTLNLSSLHCTECIVSEGSLVGFDLYVQELIVEDGSVICNFIEGDVTINGGTTTVKGILDEEDSKSVWFGMCLYGNNLTLNNGVLNMAGYASCELMVLGGEANINGFVSALAIAGGKVNIESEDYAVGSIKVIGGEVILTGETQAIKNSNSIEYSDNIKMWAGSSAADKVLVDEYFGTKYVYFETDGNTSLVTKLGDVDCDDEITSFDARLALRASIGLENLSSEIGALADADMNGAISSADARLIIRTATGLELLPEVKAFATVKKPKNVQANDDFVTLDSVVNDDKLIVSVKATNYSEFLTGDFILNYDNSLLALSNKEHGEKITAAIGEGNILYAENTDDAGKICFSYATTENLTLDASETLLTFTFDILSEATTTLSLSGKIFVVDGRYLLENNSDIYTGNSTESEETTTEPEETTTEPEETTTEPEETTTETEETTGESEKTTAHTHSFSREVIIEPGCDTIGEQEFTCSCGEIYRGIIPATGHTDGDTDGICDACDKGISEEDNSSDNNSEDSSDFLSIILSIIKKIAEFFKNLFGMA